jgi:DNA-binding transcriptional ArsR family regulator
MEKVAGTFRALAEPQRLRILQALEQGERSVGEIAVAVEGTQSNISRHLQALKLAGLVSRRRDGNSILYGIADPMIFQLCALVCHGVPQNVGSKARASKKKSSR